MDEKIREALHKAYTGEAKAALRLKSLHWRGESGIKTQGICQEG
jgi:hypothetical protein